MVHLRGVGYFQCIGILFTFLDDQLCPPVGLFSFQVGIHFLNRSVSGGAAAFSEANYTIHAELFDHADKVVCVMRIILSDHTCVPFLISTASPASARQWAVYSSISSRSSIRPFHIQIPIRRNPLWRKPCCPFRGIFLQP